MSVFGSSSPKPWVTGLLSVPIAAPPPPPSYTNIFVSLLLHPLLSMLPSPSILIKQLFSFSPGGGLPWTNIVSCASSSRGAYCAWRNGELTPMCENSEWEHCVWISLRITQSHPRSLPCTGQAGGSSGCSSIVGWKHAHNSLQPISTTNCFNFLCFIHLDHTTHTECPWRWLWESWGPKGVQLVKEASAILFSCRTEQNDT